EVKVVAKTEAVALFKNGYTVIRQEIDVPGSGVYRWEDVPAVIHGTFFIESNMDVEVRSTQRLVSVPVDEKNPPRSINDLVGREVTVYQSNGDGISGRIVDTMPPVETNSLLPELARSVARTRYDYGYSSSIYPAATTIPIMLSTPIVLESSGQHIFLTGQQITSILTKESVKERTERRPVMLFHVTKKADADGGKIRLFYLTKGATWAPSYRIDVLDGKRLRIEQTAAIRNEGMPIADTDISLVSGFPQIDCANILSPLTPSQTLEQFFRQILAQTQANLQGYRGSDFSMMSNSVLSNSGMLAQRATMPSAIANAGFDTTALAAGEGPDIHYNSIGKRSLDTGDTLSLTVGKGEAEYRRVLECDLSPQMLNNYNELVQNWHAWQNYNNQIVTPEVFDVLKFQNPLEFPMTTAPAMVTEKSRFLGQSQSYWVNPQQVASIKITKVMNLAVTYSEKAEDVQLQTFGGIVAKTLGKAGDGQSPPVRVFRNNNYIQRKVTGTIEIANRRNEEVVLHLSGVLLGKAENIEPAPAKSALSTKDYYPNELSDLFWELTLKPGEAKTMTIIAIRWFQL
ncbi:MAG: hypothetical protein LBI05_09810, partial [Planctomycetaceae bacterium]|nr:hypothetical protein [Planctomycetaceae bacterium]